MTDRTRVVLELDPELYEKLKATAEERGKTVRDVCITALEHHLNFGQALGPDPVLEELWDNEEDAVYDDL